MWVKPETTAGPKDLAVLSEPPVQLRPQSSQANSVRPIQKETNRKRVAGRAQDIIVNLSFNRRYNECYEPMPIGAKGVVRDFSAASMRTAKMSCGVEEKVSQLPFRFGPELTFAACYLRKGSLRSTS